MFIIICYDNASKIGINSDERLGGNCIRLTLLGYVVKILEQELCDAS